VGMPALRKALWSSMLDDSDVITVAAEVVVTEYVTYGLGEMSACAGRLGWNFNSATTARSPFGRRRQRVRV